MTDMFSTLNDAEIKRLDQFLLGGIDEDTDTKGNDEGMLVIRALDGFHRLWQRREIQKVLFALEVV